MNRHYRHRKPSRLDRIERKCDRILVELLAIRQSLARPDMDAAIDKLHYAARRMREQCIEERERALRMLDAKSRGV